MKNGFGGHVAGGHRRDRLVAALDRHLRLDEAALLARLHVGDLLIDITRRVPQPADIGAILGDGAETAAGCHPGPEAERIFVILEFDLGAGFQRGAEDLSVDPLLGRKLRGGDLVQLGELVRPIGETPLLAGRIDMRQMVADAGAFILRVLAQFRLPPGPFGVVERLQPRVGGLLRMGGDGCRRECDGDDGGWRTACRPLQ